MANIPFTKLEIPNGADSYVFDGITVYDLTQLDVSQFPSKDEINVINTKIDNFNNLEFVEFDYDGLMARLSDIVARIEAIEAKVGI